MTGTYQWGGKNSRYDPDMGNFYVIDKSRIIAVINREKMGLAICQSYCHFKMALMFCHALNHQVSRPILRRDMKPFHIATAVAA
jgi:hypothetical protein